MIINGLITTLRQHLRTRISSIFGVFLVALSFSSNTSFGEGITIDSQVGKKAINQVEKLFENASYMEKRITELERLEPILKAEVRAVTKLAAKASSSKDRRLATKRIREGRD